MQHWRCGFESHSDHLLKLFYPYYCSLGVLSTINPHLNQFELPTTEVWYWRLLLSLNFWIKIKKLLFSYWLDTRSQNQDLPHQKFTVYFYIPILKQPWKILLCFWRIFILHSYYKIWITWSSSRCLLLSHSMVWSKNNPYFIVTKHLLKIIS